MSPFKALGSIMTDKNAFNFMKAILLLNAFSFGAQVTTSREDLLQGRDPDASNSFIMKVASPQLPVSSSTIAEPTFSNIRVAAAGVLTGPGTIAGKLAARVLMQGSENLTTEDVMGAMRLFDATQERPTKSPIHFVNSPGNTL